MSTLYIISLRDKYGVTRNLAPVDKEDFERFGGLSWYLTGHGYVAREQQVNRQRTRIYLHRAIMGLEYGDIREVDHIDRDTLNNRRENLRIVSGGENKQNKGMYSNNKSGYRGVSWHKVAHKWCAQYRINGKTHYLGLFDDPEEAGRVAALAREETMPFAN